jgi:hypothetical protein
LKSVPPSVHILRNVTTVARAEKIWYSSFSISFNRSIVVYDVSHLELVCFSYSARISCGVAVNECTNNVAFRDAAVLRSAATTNLLTLQVIIVSDAYSGQEKMVHVLSHGGKTDSAISVSQQYCLPFLDIELAQFGSCLHRSKV